MVKFRPHKGSLSEAMGKEIEFESIEEMLAYIVDDWRNWNGKDVFEIGDLSLSEDKGKDTRIYWKETRYICTKRMGEEMYDIPQCIGMCSIEEDKQNGRNFLAWKSEEEILFEKLVDQEVNRRRANLDTHMGIGYLRRDIEEELKKEIFLNSGKIMKKSVSRRQISKWQRKVKFEMLGNEIDFQMQKYNVS